MTEDLPPFLLRRVKAAEGSGHSGPGSVFFWIHQIENIFPNKHWKGFRSDIMVTDSVDSAIDVAKPVELFALSDYTIVTCAGIIFSWSLFFLYGYVGPCVIDDEMLHRFFSFSKFVPLDMKFGQITLPL